MCLISKTLRAINYGNQLGQYWPLGRIKNSAKATLKRSLQRQSDMPEILGSVPLPLKLARYLGIWFLFKTVVPDLHSPLHNRFLLHDDRRSHISCRIHCHFNSASLTLSLDVWRLTLLYREATDFDNDHDKSFFTSLLKLVRVMRWIGEKAYYKSCVL